MGKRYKKGNIGKRKKKPSAIFKENERKINIKINQFRKIVLNYEDVTSVELYNKSDKLRREIKRLLNYQSKFIATQSHKRRFIYYDQTANFKGLYVTWKKITLPIYLSVRFDIPEHLIPALACYYRDLKRGGEPSLKIF